MLHSVTMRDYTLHFGASPTTALHGEGMRVSLAADDISPGGKWHQVFPYNATRHRSDFGEITFSPDVLRSMAANYAREGKPQRAVNYFHLGGSGTPAPIESKVAAGWISDVALLDRPAPLDGKQVEPGLYTRIQWTERARKLILADELRYLSPEFRMSQTDKQTGKDQGPTLLGLALLNDPFLTELPRVAASEKTESEEVQMKSVLAVLSLAENATEADAVKAIESLKEQSKAAQETALKQVKQLTESSAQDATKLAEVTAKLAESEKARSVLMAEKAEAEVKSFVDELVRAGKVLPAMAADVLALGVKLGKDGIKFFEKAPQAVQTGEQGISGTSGGDQKRDEASKRFNAKLDELSKTMKFTEALAAAKRELPAEYALHMSTPTPKAK